MDAAFSWAVRVLISLTTLLSLVLTSQNGSAQTATAAQCVNCHSKVTPNIVSDWRLSKHSGIEVTCVDCQGDQHPSASDVSKAKIPTPETCAQCHETQGAQFKKGKHALA
ncbi:MAG TPA: NapC/NirT family cytochrome c [Candidatus Sulfotelmatobacter sp.]|nr:NapC/NirT family cytochrome c [Candidatus Sulfotelmatobacter sp.]